MTDDVDYSVELEDDPGRIQSEEALTVTYADGSTERMRLHEYDRVYAVPGLYEEVVQRRLECESPSVVSTLMVAAAIEEGQEPSDLRVFDLGAGNGVVSEELSHRGVKTFVGIDYAPVAADAVERDRPGLYAEYQTGDMSDHARVPAVVEEHDLNALVAVAALGLGHITAEMFDAAWRTFPEGSWLGVTIPEDAADPDTSDFGDYLADEVSAGRLEERSRQRFRHRKLMDGSEVFYVAVLARKTA